MLLTTLATGGDPVQVPGVAVRTSSGGVALAHRPRPGLAALDDLPVPDYREYFARAERLGILPVGQRHTVWLPVETARGCWGEKHHCVFCGLNGTSMRFRTKSTHRVREELAVQARRYRTTRFEMVDNILDMRAFQTLLPDLVASGVNYQLFFEVKANLSRQQLRLLAQAGVRHIQPGLESLSTNVLRLMRKGSTAAQNVNLLRWARYYDMTVSWNILSGVPSETRDDYAKQAAFMADLVHLQPPASAGRIWMERFSPLYTNRHKSAVSRCVPVRDYQHIYPAQVDATKVAYFFDYDLADALPDTAYAAVRDSTDNWARAWQEAPEPRLEYWSAPHYVHIQDNRHTGRDGTYALDGFLADCYLACAERPITAQAIRDKLGQAVRLEAVTEALDAFQQRGLVFLDEPFAIALALPGVGGR